MSTSLRASIAVAVTVGVTVLGCAGRGSTGGGATEALHLDAVVDNGTDPTHPTILLEPNQQGSVTFRLDNGGVPVSGQTISFAILADDPTAPQGATLSAPTAVTDTLGLASVGIHAGSATVRAFQVQAQIGAASAKVDVIVKTGATGTLVVTPFFLSPAGPSRTNTLRVLVYEDQTCEDIDPDNPQNPSRPPSPLAVGETLAVPYASTGIVTTIYVQAMGPGPTVVATGCVDVAGSTLLPGGTVQVAVPLTDAVPDPVGTFSLTSTMTFAPPLAAAAVLAAPWAALSDCPLDPAQLWLDCTTDALSTTAGDPLDCLPAATAGAEGPIGDAMAARRGAKLVDGTGAATICRGARDARGDESLDALVQGLFGSPLRPAVVALPDIAADARSILSSVRLTSSLAVAPGTQSGSYVVTHTLDSALFGPGWSVAVPLARLGAPVLQAVTSASLGGGALNIARHGFTLRLGSAARAAFGPLALAPRGFPEDAVGFVSALFANAQAGSAAGCAALNATVCPATGQPAGCVTNACAAGLAALAALLDASFSVADGTGLDLQLAGTAPLVPVPGTLRTLRLGAGETQSSIGASWTASVETSLDHATLSVPFEGPRE